MSFKRSLVRWVIGISVEINMLIKLIKNINMPMRMKARMRKLKRGRRLFKIAKIKKLPEKWQFFIGVLMLKCRHVDHANVRSLVIDL